MCNLLPCPFCGSPAETDETGTIAYCTGNCNHTMTMVGVPVAEWNKRAESAEFKKYKEEAALDLFERRTKICELNRKLEQREEFIYDVFATLKNSNSKSTVVSVLLSRCEAQLNGQKLGVI